ncbi:MAG: hypothetical protein IK095_01705, partial [Oscillospiraceae bacterium]|nr:hypothetical protein [Oscillospiraceae bacterium]
RERLSRGAPFSACQKSPRGGFFDRASPPSILAEHKMLFSKSLDLQGFSKRRAIVLENCALPLPVAEEDKAQFPQPRHWRAVAKQAREWQSGKASKGPCPLELPRCSVI